MQTRCFSAPTGLVSVCLFSYRLVSRGVLSTGNFVASAGCRVDSVSLPGGGGGDFAL